MFSCNLNRICSHNICKISVLDKLVTDNLMKWKKLAEDRAIVVLTTLRGNSQPVRLAVACRK